MIKLFQYTDFLSQLGIAKWDQSVAYGKLFVPFCISDGKLITAKIDAVPVGTPVSDEESWGIFDFSKLSLKEDKENKITTLRGKENAEDTKYLSEKAIYDLFETLNVLGTYLGSYSTLEAFPEEGDEKDFVILNTAGEEDPRGIYVRDANGVYTLALEINEFLALTQAQVNDGESSQVGLISGELLEGRDQSKKGEPREITIGTETAIKTFTPKGIHDDIKELIAIEAISVFDNEVSFYGNGEGKAKYAIGSDDMIYKALKPSIIAGVDPVGDMEGNWKLVSGGNYKAPYYDALNLGGLYQASVGNAPEMDVVSGLHGFDAVVKGSTRWDKKLSVPDNSTVNIAMYLRKSEVDDAYFYIEFRDNPNSHHVTLVVNLSTGLYGVNTGSAEDANDIAHKFNVLETGNYYLILGEVSFTNYNPGDNLIFLDKTGSVDPNNNWIDPNYNLYIGKCDFSLAESQKTDEALLLKPVDTIGQMTEKTAISGNEIYVFETDRRYMFKPTDKLTDYDKANTNNMADDANTGLWVVIDKREVPNEELLYSGEGLSGGQTYNLKDGIKWNELLSKGFKSIKAMVFASNGEDSVGSFLSDEIDLDHLENGSRIFNFTRGDVNSFVRMEIRDLSTSEIFNTSEYTGPHKLKIYGIRPQGIVTDSTLIPVEDRTVNIPIQDNSIVEDAWSPTDTGINLATDEGELLIYSQAGSRIMPPVIIQLPILKGVEYLGGVGKAYDGWEIRARCQNQDVNDTTSSNNNIIEVAGSYDTSTSHSSTLVGIVYKKPQKTVDAVTQYKHYNFTGQPLYNDLTSGYLGFSKRGGNNIFITDGDTFTIPTDGIVSITLQDGFKLDNPGTISIEPASGTAIDNYETLLGITIDDTEDISGLLKTFIEGTGGVWSVKVVNFEFFIKANQPFKIKADLDGSGVDGGGYGRISMRVEEIK